ncbi:MAG: CTP synthase [Lachnospiraceae bacterium]
MDEMKIVSKFTTNMISKLVKMVLRKKLGYDIDIQLNEIKTTITDGKTHVHLDVDAELEKEELVKILKKIGLS